MKSIVGEQLVAEPALAFARAAGAHLYDREGQRWLDFIHWEVDGICTDYPGALANTLLRMNAARPIAV